MAAAAATKAGASVIVLEKMPRAGRKIMITGKGRCNFTNEKDWSDFSALVHPKANLLKSAFYAFPPQAVIEFFESHGVSCIVERGDRAFPLSHVSADIVDALVRSASSARLLYNKTVTSITPSTSSNTPEGEPCGPCHPVSPSPCYLISCSDGSTYPCQKLIIATGGLSYPTTGSTGDGLKWAADLGLCIAPTYPSLTALVPRGYKLTTDSGHIHRETALSELGRSLLGCSLANVNLTLMIDGNPAQEEFGDIDFTDGGIEGPVGFKLSRKCVHALLHGSKASIIIDLKPAVEPQSLEKRISSLWKEINEDKRSQGKRYDDKMRVLLRKLLPQDLIPAFTRCNPSVDHRSLSKALKNWKFDINGYVGYERCVVTAGGISSSEIIAKTLASKTHPDLYFAGEILDLDADTGGYNLQIAFCTGHLAGLSAAASLTK